MGSRKYRNSHCQSSGLYLGMDVRAPFAFPEKSCLSGVYEFIEVLEAKSIPWAIFSDLDAKAKTQTLGFHPSKAYAASDLGVDALKPKPVGLIKIAKDMGVQTEDILFIGDQEELDGYCAKQAACDFVLIKPQYAAQQYQELIDCFG